MNDTDEAHVLPAPGESSCKKIIFIGLGNRLPADPIFDKIFNFLGIDRKKIVVFTQIAGDLKRFAEFLAKEYREVFSEAILLFSSDGDIAVPDDLNRLELPIPWEAFKIFENGCFSRVSETGGPIHLPPIEERAKTEDALV